MKKISNKKFSFIIALIYVGLGTIYSGFYWTDYGISFLNDSNVLFGIFMPVAFFPIGFIYAESEPFFLILISQTLTLFFVWVMIYGLITIFRTAILTSDNQKKRKNEIGHEHSNNQEKK